MQYVIEWAYGIRTGFSVPDWANPQGDRFDIEGKTSRPATGEDCKVMAQGLLEERFSLKLH